MTTAIVVKQLTIGVVFCVHAPSGRIAIFGRACSKILTQIVIGCVYTARVDYALVARACNRVSAASVGHAAVSIAPDAMF